MAAKYKNEYQEITLDNLVQFWVDAYKVTIHSYEYFIDTSKGKIVLKLLVNKGQLAHPDCNCGICALCTGDE